MDECRADYAPSQEKLAEFEKIWKKNQACADWRNRYSDGKTKIL